GPPLLDSVISTGSATQLEAEEARRSSPTLFICLGNPHDEFSTIHRLEDADVSLLAGARYCRRPFVPAAVRSRANWAGRANLGKSARGGRARRYRHGYLRSSSCICRKAVGGGSHDNCGSSSLRQQW